VRDALGAEAIVNDWSVNPANGVSTDWVVTLPGQYLMLNLPVYLDAEAGKTECVDDGTAARLNAAVPAPTTPVPVCDARDIPVEVFFATLDREEAGFVNPEGGLVISPKTTDREATAHLPYEVNVIEWTDGTNEPVLDSQFATSADVSSLGAPFGWAELSVKSDPAATKVTGIVNKTLTGVTPQPPYVQDPFDFARPAIPIIGFVAWERSFASNPSANYGRAVDHSYKNIGIISS
jgi:hypothetical protein